MFEQATATADQAHRSFFGRGAEFRQVWARQADGTLFYLADGAVDSDLRAATHGGRLTCPHPGCPDPRFIAKGGSERRHHFAHRVAGQEHRTAAAWRHQALLMLADWSKRHDPSLDVDVDDREEGDSLRLRSPQSGRVVRLAVTYDRRHQVPPPAAGEQLLVGHSRALLLPRREAEGAPGHWWCGQTRLVGDLTAKRGWALAVNPQNRLIATVTLAQLARRAGLIRELAPEPLLLVVDELDHARLDADGVHTPTSDSIDRELDRRRGVEAERERRRRDAESQARAGQRVRENEYQPSRAQAQGHPRLTTSLPTPGATRGQNMHASPHDDRGWPRDLEALRRLVGDEELARRVEQPLSTDVECHLPPAIWHLIAVLEWQKRGADTHPQAIRAAIVQDGCGYNLTGDAIAGVLAVARRRCVAAHQSCPRPMTPHATGRAQ